jgi:hypothetical protein
LEELLFLAGVFFDFELPKDKLYLFKYFKTFREKQFLKYYYCFGNYEFFMARTGIVCDSVWLELLKKYHDVIVAKHMEAKREMDFTLLANIEQGKCKKSMFLK